MTCHRAWFLTVALCLALSACTLVNDGESDPDVYEGFYAQGIEDSVFEPCHRDEVWQITEGDEAAVQRFLDRVFDEIRAGHNPVYARLRGVLSPRGQIPGFFVTYDRTLELTEVLDVRTIRGDDCR
jgi:hypothetical protein